MGDIPRRRFIKTGLGAGVATGMWPAMTASADSPGSLRAGAAKSDITNRDKNAVVKDPLFAKALVLDDGATRLVLVAMDATAIGGRSISRGALNDVADDFMPKLRDRIQKELGIPGQSVLVNASHTHPPGKLLCDDVQQIERVFDAVARAANNMTPVRVGSGAGREDRIAMNRTLRLKNGKHWTIRHTNPSPPDDEVAGLGPIDPEIGVLRIDRLDGRPLAAVYNFACHPLFGDARGSITANFPGVASRVIEESLGHGATALFIQGAGGDVCDVQFKDFNRPRDVTPLGEMLGLSALKAIRAVETQDASLRVVDQSIELPRRTDILERIAALRQEQSELLASLRHLTLNFKSFLPLYLKRMHDPRQPSEAAFLYLHEKQIGADQRTAMDAMLRSNVDKYLKNIRAMEKLSRIQDQIATLEKHESINRQSGQTTITAEVQGIRIGDCAIVSAPIELLTEVGLNVKKASPFPHTLVAAFSNGYMHYGPPADYYDKGGYEVTECLLAPEWQKIYESAAQEILKSLL